MAAFFSDVLDEFLTLAFLEGVREKFHYGKTEAAEFQAVAEELLPLIRKEAFWESKAFSQKKFCPQGERAAAYESVVLSLGSGVDSLQESYSEKGMLSQCYMIEVLASELLRKGYDAYNRFVKENTDWHVARYHFLGSEDEFPLELLPSLLSELTPKVICNSAFYMMPKKSVAFVAELTQDEKIHCRGVCVGCNRAHCPNRIAENDPIGRRIFELTDLPLTYGYSRIFGSW